MNLELETKPEQSHDLEILSDQKKIQEAIKYPCFVKLQQ
jgi:hypothetical protein